MNNLPQIFDFQNSQVRVIIQDGEPWFVATDVANILDLANLSESIKRLDDDEVNSTEVIDSLGRKQITTIINEPGLYSFVLGSRKSEAKLFKRWITHEVIPAIRKNGSYQLKPISQAEMLLQAAQLMVEQERKLLALETKQTAQDETIKQIKEALLPTDKEWRKSINEKLNKIARACDLDYKGVREKSYQALESRAGCILSRRVTNLKNRLSEGGATRTAIGNACKLDAIEADKKLKEIYSSIVREMVVKYVA